MNEAQVTEAGVRFVEFLSTAGGTFALTFIVGLAVAICGLTLAFLGSAVVVLERFARAERRPLSVLGVVLAWAILLAPLVVSEVQPELTDKHSGFAGPVLGSLRALDIAGVVGIPDFQPQLRSEIRRPVHTADRPYCHGRKHEQAAADEAVQPHMRESPHVREGRCGVLQTF